MPYSTESGLRGGETKAVSIPVQILPLAEMLALVAVMLALLAVVLALVGSPEVGTD